MQRRTLLGTTAATLLATAARAQAATIGGSVVVKMNCGA